MGEIAKGHKETFRGDEYVHYLDSGDVSWVYTYIKTFQNMHLNYVPFILCHLNLNSTVKNVLQGTSGHKG